MYLHGQFWDNLQDACNPFADFFESVYTPSPNRSKFCNVFGNSKFLMFRLQLEDVLSELLNLDISQSAGSDSVPPIVLKMTAAKIAHPITMLFNKSIADGYFPKLWKCSVIKPIHKSGARSDIENYRGISILSVLPKLFEKMLKDYLFFYTKQFISSKQHGFCLAITNLLLLTNYITVALSKGSQVQVVYTDFSKAFDKIDHELLLQKLCSLEMD